MNYSIGEVSDLLHLSRDMIRYYEKQGTIHSKRNTSNNYRYYDEMDIFWLLEAMQHKSWGINISEIADVRLNQYAENTGNRLGELAAKLEEEVSYKTLLLARLKRLRRGIALSFANIGNFWIDEIPAYYAVHLVDGEGDHYHRIDLPDEAGKVLFSERVVPFTDSGFTLDGNRQSWELRIRQDYVQSLGITPSDDFHFSPKRICLCTNADIGKIGEFHLEAMTELKDYAKTHHYRVKADVPIRALLADRGVEDGAFHRVVEWQLDIDL